MAIDASGASTSNTVGAAPLTALGNSSGTVNLNLATGTDWTMTATGNVTLTVSNVPTGVGVSVSVLFTQDGTGGWTLTLPSSSIKTGSLGSAAAAKTIVAMVTYDGGVTWYVNQVTGFA